MSHAPFGWPSVPQATLQPQSSNQEASGWVSFDDAPPAFPTASPAVSATAHQAPGGLQRPPPYSTNTAAVGHTAPFAPAPTPTSSTAASPAFPTFAALHASTPAPAGATAAGAAPAPHRLARPPTSTAAPSAPAATAPAIPPPTAPTPIANPFASTPAIILPPSAAATPSAPATHLPHAAPAPAPAANPFAAGGPLAGAGASLAFAGLGSTSTGAGAGSAAGAGAGSNMGGIVDPFADLTLMPQLPRPPPMAALKPHQGQVAPGALPAFPAAPQPAAAAPTATPVSAAPAFPSFAALHSALPRPPPATAAAAPQPANATAVTSVSPLASTAAGGGAVASGGAAGVIQTTTFDLSDLAATTATATRPAPPPPPPVPYPQSAYVPTSAPAPPPPYEDALNLPQPAAPSLRVDVPSDALPPPPPPTYSSALGMPSVSSPGATSPPRPPDAAFASPQQPPPPSYGDVLDELYGASPGSRQPPQTSPPSYGAVLGNLYGAPDGARQPPPPPSYDASAGMPLAAAATAAAAAAPPPPSYQEALWDTFDSVGARAGSAAPAQFSVSSSSSACIATTPSAASPKLAPIDRLPTPHHRVTPDALFASLRSANQQQLQQQQPLSQQPPLPAQIAIDVRLPPMRPTAAWPTLLAAGMGHVFAAPANEGAVALQWCLGEDSPDKGGGGLRYVMPQGGDVLKKAGAGPVEDWDSAAAGALIVPSEARVSETVCCMLVDEGSGHMWTGHADGRVVRWAVSPGHVAVYEHQWLAHQLGKVTALAVSPWGDLWTAAASGSVRVWSYAAQQQQPGLGQASKPPLKLIECRRSRTLNAPPPPPNTRGGTLGARPHSKSRHLALGPSGRVMWSAGKTSLALWAAYSGDFLGSMSPGEPQGGDEGGEWENTTKINPATGVEPGLVQRVFEARREPEVGEEADSGDPAISMQVIKGINLAAKFAVKLGKKIKQTVGDGLDGNNSGFDSGGGHGGYGNTAVGGGGGSGALTRGNIKALVAGVDGSMFVAYKNGVVDKYTEWGRLVWSRDVGVKVHCAVLVGPLLWLGCADGQIRTLAAGSGEPGRRWRAADFAVVRLAADGGPRGAGLVHSLSDNGGVRAWPAAAPTEAHLAAWRDGLPPLLKRNRLVVLAGTWNVNETRCSEHSISRWLVPRAAKADIVAVALQEVEMGTSSVAMDAAYSMLYRSKLEKGTNQGQWWANAIAASLAETPGEPWERVALRQMSGLVLVVFCRRALQLDVGEVSTTSVACGVMGVGGNKGAVAVSMTLFRRRVVFVCSHFAAHQERVDERNANYNKIVRQLHFSAGSKTARRRQQQEAARGAKEAAAAAALMGQGSGGAPLTGGMPLGGMGAVAGPTGQRGVADEFGRAEFSGSAAEEAEEGEAASCEDVYSPGMAEAAMLVWAGDFNYRIEGTYDEVCRMAREGAFAQLFAIDQARELMERGVIFRGLREPLPLGHPTFPPTYKFDKPEKGTAPYDRLPYDRSEKRRIPAWTDRVFYRGSRPGSTDVPEEEVLVGVLGADDYGAVMDVWDSDHRPVHALLHVELPCYDQFAKRRHGLAVAAAVHRAACAPAAAALASQPRDYNADHHAHAAPSRCCTVSVLPPALTLAPGSSAAVELHSGASVPLVAHVYAELVGDRPLQRPYGGPRLVPLPPWLEVSPVSFLLPPAQRPQQPGGGGPLLPGVARVALRTHSMEGAPRDSLLQLRLRFRLESLWGAPQGVAAAMPGVAVTVKVP